MGQSLIAIYFGEPLSPISPSIIIKKKKKRKKKKNKNRDSSNRHRLLSLPTRGQQISQIKMGLLRRRLIFAKAFDMNKFSMDKIWLVSTLEDTRCISTWQKSFCLFTAGLYFGDVLHNVYINFLAALALYALGQWLFITALSSWQCLYQRELVGPMRWVKVFFCFIDRWFVFAKRQDHNLIVHLVFKIALHSMTCIVNPSTAREEMKLQSVVELSYLTVSGW